VENKQSKRCCEMRSKVSLGIAKVYSEEESGVSDAVLADFHNFDYVSESKMPVAAALTLMFCPWCGAERRDGEKGRTTEVIRPYHSR
jgi:hypothetical protein